ncbi:MAG: T9SS type A sorting domain-containing protein [Bacteroidota bacterium]
MSHTSTTSTIHRFATNFIKLALLLGLVLPVMVCEAQTNLIINGDFSSTDPADPQSPYFDTEYTYNSAVNGLYTEGTYVIANNPLPQHSSFCDFDLESERSPISGGNMLIGNASTAASKKLWAQRVTVTPRTNYTFSFYASSLAGVENAANNLLFGLYVDCKRVGADITIPTECNWVKFTINFNSGNLTSMELSIRNLSIENLGNDIAIDDISFISPLETPSPAYAQVYEFIWKGYSTNWFNADNWGSCTLPTCDDDVIIPSGLANYPIIPAGVSANSLRTGSVGSLTIQPGASLSISQFSELNVCGNIINNGTLIRDSQSLVTLIGLTDQTLTGGQYTNLRVNKPSGSAVLGSNITVTGTLTLSQGLVKTNAYELYVSNTAQNAIASYSGTSYVVGNLRRGIIKNGLVVNPAFEADNAATSTPAGWTTDWTPIADYTETGNPVSGNYHLTHSSTSAYHLYTYQTITGLATGTYTLKAWVKSSGGQSAAYMEAKNFGGATLQTNFGALANWTQISITNIQVTNGECTIGFWSASTANKWAYMDDVEFHQQLVVNPSFDASTPTLTGWSTATSTNSENADFSEAYAGTYGGAYHLTHWTPGGDYKVYTYQTLTGLTNGTYTMKAWVKGGGSQKSAYMEAKDYGSTALTSTIGNTSNQWVQISITGIKVTNNQCTIGFYSDAYANNWMYADEVEFYREDPIHYDFPLGDATHYKRAQMTMSANLGVNSILGIFTPNNPSGTTGLPLVENGNQFDELYAGGYWTLTPDILPMGSALYEVELFLPSAPAGYSTMTLAKRHDAASSWNISNTSPTGDYTPKTSYRRTGYSTFSEYALVSGEPIILPVQLLSFRASATALGRVALEWSTAQEQNSDWFIVERSQNAEVFTEVGRVKATENSHALLSYTYQDNKPLMGLSYYRLKQIDIDGTAAYSKMAAVTIETSVTDASFKVYPNPSDGKALQLLTDYEGQAEITVSNHIGVVVVAPQPIQVSNGSQSLDIPQLPKGVYIVTMKEVNKISQQKLIVQ